MQCVFIPFKWNISRNKKQVFPDYAYGNICKGFPDKRKYLREVQCITKISNSKSTRIISECIILDGGAAKVSESGMCHFNRCYRQNSI